MRTITTTTGVQIKIDGDLLSIMETLYKEVSSRQDLEVSFEDMMKEIKHLIGHMEPAEQQTYLIESLFLNTVKYENDKLETYMKKLKA